MSVDVVQRLIFDASVKNAEQSSRKMQSFAVAVTAVNQALELGKKAAQLYTRSVEQTVGASLEQERGVRQMVRALEGAGIAYEEVTDRIDEFLDRRQALTRFGDDVSRDVIRQIAQSTGALRPSIEDIFELSSLAQDVAEATGRDVMAAAQIVSRVAAGNVESLNELTPAYKDLIAEITRMPSAAERGAQAMEILRAEFEGAAEDIDPLDLALQRIRNGLGDIREAQGDLTRQNPQVVAAFEDVADMVDRVAKVLGEGGEAASAFETTIAGAARTGVQAVTALAVGVIRTITTLQAVSREIEGNLEDNRQAQAARAQELLSSYARVSEDELVDRLDVMQLRVMQGGLSFPAQRREAIRIAQAYNQGEMTGEEAAQAFDTVAASLGDFIQQSQSATAALDEQIRVLRAGADQLIATIRADGQGDGTGFTEAFVMGRVNQAIGRAGSTMRPTGAGAGLGGERGGKDSAAGQFGLGDEIERRELAAEKRMELYTRAVAKAEEERIQASQAIRDELIARLDLEDRLMQKARERSQAEKDAAYETQQALRELRDSLSDVAVSGFGDLSTMGLEALGTLAVGADVSGQQMSAGALRGIGTIASQLGAVVLAAGAAGIAVPFLGINPVGAKIAGGVLIGLGATMRGMAAGVAQKGGGGSGGALPSARAAAGIGGERSRSGPQFVTQKATYIETLITEDERTTRRLNELSDEQRRQGAGRL